jgi:O-antigen/teichoic acid export membrane protein
MRCLTNESGASVKTNFKLMDESRGKPPSLRSQSAWLMFAKVIAFGLGLLIPFLVVRVLTQEMVGVYRQTFQVITNAVAILPLGFSMSSFYFLNREVENRKAAILNILLVNFIVGGLACLGLYLFPSILGGIFQSTEMTRLAPMIGVAIWLWIFSSFLEVVTVANKEARVATVFIILSQLIKTALMAGAIVWFATIDAFIYAAIIQAVIQSVVLLAYLNARFPYFWRKFDFRFFGAHASYTLPFGLTAILWTLQNDIHNYFVGYRFTEAEYAIYAYGCFQLPLIGILAESTAQVLLPRMNELQLRDDRREMVLLTSRAMERLSFFYFPAYVFLIITAEAFITTLFTRNFEASVPIFMIYLTLLPFNIWVVDPIIRAYKSFGRVLLLLRMGLLVALIISLYYGIHHFGLSGMTAIVVVATLVEKSVSTVIVGRKMRLKAGDWALLGGIGWTAAAAGISGLIHYGLYVVFHDELSEISFVFGSWLLTPFNLHAGTEFVGGCLYLAFWFVIYMLIYLFLMHRFGAIQEQDVESVKVACRKISRLRRSSV